MLIVIMLSVFAEYRYAECIMLGVAMVSVAMPSVTIFFLR